MGRNALEAGEPSGTMSNSREASNCGISAITVITSATRATAVMPNISLRASPTP